MNTVIATFLEQERKHPLGAVVLMATLWGVVYASLEPLSFALVGLLPLESNPHLAESLQFFLYDAPKVLLLLVGVVFLMGAVHTFVSPHHTRRILADRGGAVGNAMAAALGVVTPFCSCSAVPLFIGFLQARVPLGVTFSFLIAAPMVNEVALVMLFGLVGWEVAALYLLTGLLIAIIAGVVLGAMNLDHWLEGWVLELRETPPAEIAREELTWADRLEAGRTHVQEIVGKVWLYVVVGVGLGAAIHGYVPEDFMASVMGADTWWSVPAAVLLGIPMYTNAAGVIPVVEALLSKGASLGTALAFMMSVIALSAPEMIILRKVLTPKLIAAFVGVVSTGILLVGFLFNFIL